MLAQCSIERWKVGLDHITNDLELDPEILVYKDVSEASDLRPSDLWMRVGDFHRQVVRCLSNDLEVALDRVLCHIGEIGGGIAV